VEELSASIASDDADLQAATKIRNAEAADFAVEEKDLVEVTGMLERAISILEREMKKGVASMMQLQNAKTTVDALGALVEASVISSADSKRLAALVRSSQEAKGSDDELGAPAAAVYEGHSGGIIGTLEDLLGKAEAQLESARKSEQASLHNYQMLSSRSPTKLRSQTRTWMQPRKARPPLRKAKPPQKVTFQ